MAGTGDTVVNKTTPCPHRPYKWEADIQGYDTKSTSNNSKNGQVGLHQTKNLLHSKGNNQQRKKTTLPNRRKYLQTIYLIRG